MQIMKQKPTSKGKLSMPSMSQSLENYYQRLLKEISRKLNYPANVPSWGLYEAAVGKPTVLA